MGSNSAVLHATHPVAPSVTMPAASGSSAEHVHEAILAMQKAKIIAMGGADPDDPHGMPIIDVDPDDVVGTYAMFCEAVGEARQHLAALLSEVEPTEDIAALQSDLQDTTKSYLGALDVDDLQKIAADNGFQHPELAGTDLFGQHPLVHWLDPANGDDLASQAMVQQKALERYEIMLAGQAGAIGAPTAPHSADGDMPPATEDTWEATPEEVSAAASETIALARGMQDHIAHDVETGQDLAQLIAAENKLATATCADVDVEKIKAAVRAHVDKALAGSALPGVDDLAHAAYKARDLTPDEKLFLSPAETVVLLRRNAPETDRQAVKDAVTQRGMELTTLLEAAHALGPYKNAAKTALDLPTLTGGGAESATVARFADAAAAYAAAHQAVEAWLHTVPKLAAEPYPAPAQLTNEFSTWAAQQNLGHLRQAAATMGLQNSAKASRAKIRKWIAAHWDTSLSSEHVPASSTSKKTTKANKPAAAGAPPPQPSKIGSSNSSAGQTVAPRHVAGFVAKHRELVAALRQAKAAAYDLPEPRDPAEVASWSFGPGKPAQLGGMHTKTLHAAPDGSMWLFKPDKKHHGARAHAEMAASAAFRAAGVPSVPVYVKQIGGKTGSVQPLLKNAHQLPAGPADWSQADIDAIVRFHVASWMVGDHDGKSDNVLRTSSGGLVPVDQGQAFKFYGTDKLAVDYHPNASFGAEPPVFQQAYKAYLAGKLGKGVTINPAAAHPVIKAFEAIPDDRWRAVLRDTAHQGARHNVAWVPAMRTRAAKNLGIPASKVTAAQIAEAFLDHAVERKHGLRAAFAELFAGALKLPGGAALKDGE